jgi:beta-lactam-binding protein with PASTA domain
MLLTGRATVRLARLEGLAKPTATARLNRAHLKAEFSGRYSSAAPGTVVDQTPRAGTRVKQGSTVLVVLSRGPRPIEVPSVTRQSENAATGRLHRLNLTVKVTPVPAPGTTPGIVVGQSPSAGHHLHPHATVALSVAEVPKWQSVTSFSGSGSGQSAPFHIRGTQWRVVYTMTYQGTCDFVFFCYGPSAHVIGIGSANPTDTSFDLSDGGTQTRVFKTGTGRYQIAIKPGLDSARWSIEVDDWY